MTHKQYEYHGNRVEKPTLYSQWLMYLESLADDVLSHAY
jgi:hypothetical protein